MKNCMIYTTTNSAAEARNLAKILVKERLVACVNVLDGVTSIYRWEGDIESESETVLIAKTSISRREEVFARINEIHSYDTPCLVSYDIAHGSPEYLNWIQSQTERS